jgi:signal peptidase II
MRPIERQATGLVVLVLLADLISKQLLLNHLSPDSVTPVVDGLFRLVMAWNLGVSFSILGGDKAVPAWVLSAVALGICLGLLVWLRRTDREVRGWGIGLVMGGAIGNVIDRARWGAVFDFADFYIGQWHWPVFNLADVAIVAGVALICVDSLVGERQRSP